MTGTLLEYMGPTSKAMAARVTKACMLLLITRLLR